MRIVWNGTPRNPRSWPAAAWAGPTNTRCVPGASRARTPWDAFDALLREAYGPLEAASTHEHRVGLRTHAWETESALVVRLEVPGVTRDNVRVEVEGDVLVVEARRSLDAPEGFEPLARGRRGTVGTTRLRVAEAYDLGEVAATLRDGVIEVRVPRRAATPRRVIPIAVNAAPATQLEGNGPETPSATADEAPTETT